MAGTTARYFGDSNMLGAGVVTSSNRWTSRVAAAEGWDETMYAIGGKEAADSSSTNALTGATILDGDVCLMQFENGMRFGGFTASVIADNYRTYLYYLAHMLAPTAKRLYAQGGSITTAGGSGWTDNPAYGGVRYAASSGCTATFTAVGDTIVLAMLLTSGGGTFTVSVDGVVKTAETTDAATVSSEYPGYRGGAFVLTGQGPGTHTVIITTTSAGLVFLNWVASFAVPPRTRAFVGGVPFLPADAYATGSPFNVGSDAACVAWSNMTRAAVAVMRRAGFDASFVPLYLPSNAWYSDHVHYSEGSGHPLIAAQWQAVIDGDPVVAARVVQWVRTAAVETAFDGFGRVGIQSGSGDGQLILTGGVASSDVVKLNGSPAAAQIMAGVAGMGFEAMVTAVGGDDLTTVTISNSGVPLDTRQSLLGWIVHHKLSGRIAFVAAQSGYDLTLNQPLGGAFPEVGNVLRLVPPGAMQVAGLATPAKADVAAAILANPAAPLVTDDDGNVTTNNPAETPPAQNVQIDVTEVRAS